MILYRPEAPKKRAKQRMSWVDFRGKRQTGLRWQWLGSAQVERVACRTVTMQQYLGGRQTFFSLVRTEFFLLEAASLLEGTPGRAASRHEEGPVSADLGPLPAASLGQQALEWTGVPWRCQWS